MSNPTLAFIGLACSLLFPIALITTMFVLAKKGKKA